MLEKAGQAVTVVQAHRPDPVGFFDDTYAFFQRVSHKVGGTLDNYYDLHGHLIRLSFAGRALTKIPRALAHWEAEPNGTPELTICLWDSADTKTRMLPPPWLGKQPPYTRRGEVHGYNTNRIRTAFQMGSDVLHLLDLQRGLAIYWTRDATHLPQWEIGSPLRIILHWWLHQFGLQYVHAGAVGTPEGGVLLVGKGGSGKSTTSLTCLNSDLNYVSDDYCLISTNSGPRAYNLYNTGKVRIDNLNRVPHLKSIISSIDHHDQEKALFFLDQHLPEKLVPGFPIKAVLIPQVTGEVDTSLAPASVNAALSGLTISTMFQLAGAGPAELKIMKDFVDQVPSFFLRLGTDLAQIPDAILRLLAQD